MNPQDIIITALTPHSAFNPNGKTWRRLDTLAEFTGLESGDVLELLAGDLAAAVACKASQKGKGVLVALKENLPEAGQPQQVAVAGGPAFQPDEPEQAEENAGAAEAVAEEPAEEVAELPLPAAE